MFVKQNDKAKYFSYTVKQENGTPIRRHSWEMEHLSSNIEHLGIVLSMLWYAAQANTKQYRM